MGKCSTTNGLMGAPVTGKPVTECQDLGEVFAVSYTHLTLPTKRIV